MTPMTRELLGRTVLLAVALGVPLYIVTSAATRAPALEVPVTGVLLSELRDNFDEARDGARRHGAIDIEAPEGTAVVAASSGVVSRISTSALGGRALYVIDRGAAQCHYYGHLSRYAPGLEEGQRIERGETLGFVGSTGNASPDAPHLHFAVYPLRSGEACALEEPLNPYPLLTAR